MNLLENEQIEKIADQYQQLSGRDKALTQFLTVFVIICIGYFFIYSPSVSKKQEATEQLNRTQNIYRDIQKIVPQILQARQNAAQASQSNRSNANNANKSMQAMVNTSKDKFKIDISKSTADGVDGIIITGNAQIFDNLILLIGDLTTSYGLTVESFNIKETVTAGKVDFNLKLKR